MTDSNAKSRAVVLGGGGPVGVAWELGLAAGLREGGVDLAEAAFVVGTSAGSITGAIIKSGEDVDDLANAVGEMFDRSVSKSGVDQLPTGGLSMVMEMILGPADDEEVDETELRARIGKGALQADTIDEHQFVGSMAEVFAEQVWPEGFACTAVEAETGVFQIWDESSDVPLERAIASSCSVPYIYPPITIKGRRYVDGGMRSPLNADLASGHDAVVVVSCMMMDLPPFFDDPRIKRFFDAQRASLEHLESTTGSVELIAPDEEFLNISGFGMSLMDFTKAREAAEAGRRLGKQEAPRIAACW